MIFLTSRMGVFSTRKNFVFSFVFSTKSNQWLFFFLFDGDTESKRNFFSFIPMRHVRCLKIRAQFWFFWLAEWEFFQLDRNSFFFFITTKSNRCLFFFSLTETLSLSATFLVSFPWDMWDVWKLGLNFDFSD